jgi:hypothetical protein
MIGSSRLTVQSRESGREAVGDMAGPTLKTVGKPPTTSRVDPGLTARATQATVRAPAGTAAAAVAPRPPAQGAARSASARPTASTARAASVDLGILAALTQWQSGEAGGASRLSAAARALTGTAHFYTAELITKNEREARRHPCVMAAAAALLRAVNEASPRDAEGWNRALGRPSGTFAGRMIGCSSADDEQFLAHVSRGRLDIPLWSVSLDHDVAVRAGGSFRLEIEGAFPGLPAWTLSGLKEDDAEIITGGRYDVLGTYRDGSVIVVRLRYVKPLGEHVGDDHVLLDLLALMPDVHVSELTEMGLPGADEHLEMLRAKTDDGRQVTAVHTGEDPDVITVKRRVPTWGAGHGAVEETTFPGKASALRDLVAALRR